MEKENIYIYTWRNKWITSQAKTIDDFISTFEALAKKFKDWKDWGKQLLDDGGAEEDYATFIINNMDIAIKAGFSIKDIDNNEYLQTISGKEVEILRKKE